MDNRKNKLGFTLFIIVIIIIGVGGFIAMRRLTNSKPSGGLYNNNSTSKVSDTRVDKSKDYVYFENIKTVINDLNIEFKDIYINLEVANSINTLLNNETEPLRKTIKYLKDVEIPDDVEYEENEEGVYSVSYRDYIEFDYENYISILVEDNDYDVINGSIPKSIKSYVFDKTKNQLLSEAVILSNYKMSMDAIKEKIKVKLNAEQETIDGQPYINVDTTVNDLHYALSINKIGKLEVDYIVSSTKQNFYDKIVLE